jgi:hypothetical protein
VPPPDTVIGALALLFESSFNPTLLMADRFFAAAEAGSALPAGAMPRQNVATIVSALARVLISPLPVVLRPLTRL